MYLIIPPITEGRAQTLGTHRPAAEIHRLRDDERRLPAGKPGTAKQLIRTRYMYL